MMASDKGAVDQEAVTNLIEGISIKSRSGAACIASVINSGKGPGGQLLNTVSGLAKSAGKADKQVIGTLCIGEYGRVKSLKTEKALSDIIINNFKAADQEVREAASIALGNISAGAPEYFLEQVFGMINKADPREKYLYLLTIKEMILHEPKHLVPYQRQLEGLL